MFSERTLRRVELDSRVHAPGKIEPRAVRLIFGHGSIEIDAIRALPRDVAGRTDLSREIRVRKQRAILRILSPKPLQ